MKNAVIASMARTVNVVHRVAKMGYATKYMGSVLNVMLGTSVQKRATCIVVKHVII